MDCLIAGFFSWYRLCNFPKNKKNPLIFEQDDLGKKNFDFRAGSAYRKTAAYGFTKRKIYRPSGRTWLRSDQMGSAGAYIRSDTGYRHKGHDVV